MLSAASLSVSYFSRARAKLYCAKTTYFFFCGHAGLQFVFNFAKNIYLSIRWMTMV